MRNLKKDQYIEFRNTSSLCFFLVNKIKKQNFLPQQKKINTSLIKENLIIALDIYI